MKVRYKIPPPDFHNKKTCILDSSSAILLWQATLLPALARFYKTILPVAVFEEITIVGYPGADDFSSMVSAGDIAIEQTYTCTVLDSCKLGCGEKEVLSIFLHGRGDFIFTDDKKAALVCKDHNIPYINSLLFPKVLYFADVLNLNEMEVLTTCLVKKGRYSRAVITFADNCGKDELKRFLP